MRKRQPSEGQASLFSDIEPRVAKRETVRSAPPSKAESITARKWQMPATQGRTVAEIRLRWPKRLTPGQVARVEAELSRLPQLLGKLGFGPVQVERVFVRRRKS